MFVVLQAIILLSEYSQELQQAMHHTQVAAIQQPFIRSNPNVIVESYTQITEHGTQYFTTPKTDKATFWIGTSYLDKQH